MKRILNKLVCPPLPTGGLFQVLRQAHSRILHRGRQIIFNYAEVNQKVVNIFVKMCRFHGEQRSITNRVKIVDKTLQAPTFLSLIEIDLMDLRKCPCDCGETHTWIMNVTGHHTKHVTLCALPAKSAEKVLSSLQQYCYSYGYPKSILCSNGREFCNQIMETFCQKNGIIMKHGVPTTPTTQGLIERSNRSCKEDLHTLIVSTTRNNSKWCSCLSNISYTRNITIFTRQSIQRPTKLCLALNPTEKYHGTKTQRRILKTAHNNLSNLTPAKSFKVNIMNRHLMRNTKEDGKKYNSQAQYNENMIKQCNTKDEKKCSEFKVGDVVSIKIDKVDKAAPFHPNMPFGKKHYTN